jgi:activating signal cointegrator 1
MKCISLWQPWASLLANGKKKAETRHWPIHYRGPMLIHAAKKWSGELNEVCHTKRFKTPLCEIFGSEHKESAFPAWGKILPFGAIIGRVNVVSCISTNDIHFAEEDCDYCRIGMQGGWQFPKREEGFGDYSCDRLAWLCSDFTPFAEPLRYTGNQGLFDVPDHLIEAAMKLMKTSEVTS